jgi:hypothetical protein
MLPSGPCGHGIAVVKIDFQVRITTFGRPVKKTSVS